MLILKFLSRNELRDWFLTNTKDGKEFYIHLKRGKPSNDGNFYYLDAIEEALCFGYIDSTLTSIDGISYQRFSPRRKGCNWTELNKERARRLIKLGLMHEEGLKTLPPLGLRSFKPDQEIVDILKKNRVWSKFKTLPVLYQRVRLNNLAFYKERHIDGYERMLKHTIEETRKGKTFGEWNDYGRLVNY